MAKGKVLVYWVRDKLEIASQSLAMTWRVMRVAILRLSKGVVGWLFQVSSFVFRVLKGLYTFYLLLFCVLCGCYPEALEGCGGKGSPPVPF